MRRAGPPALLVAGVVALCPGAAAAATDPAVAALRPRDAYVSPAALGGESAAAEERLAEAAATLSRQGRPVKVAIVAGPAGAPSMRGYAARLRRQLGTDRTVVVTAPMRPVVAVGPRAPAEVTRRLRAAGVGRLRDPVARVIAAARAVAPTARAAGSNVREVGALLGLAVLGGIWAVAIGLRRERRRADDRAAERRAALHVHLDALGAQAAWLDGRDDLPSAARAELERAREIHASAAQALQGARDAPSLAAVAASVRQGLAALSGARRLADEERPDDPFAGLCATDPAHGRAGAPDAEPALCDECREAAALGQVPEVRRVLIGGAPRPFRDAALDARPGEHASPVEPPR